MKRHVYLLQGVNIWEEDERLTHLETRWWGGEETEIDAPTGLAQDFPDGLS